MDFKAESFKIFDENWALLTAGNKENFNAMTISWGGLGTLWNKPVATVYVKPARYTHKFMEESEYFTVSFYGEEYRSALGIMGSLSGRDCDKVAKAKLSPKALGNAVTFGEAEKTLLCKKIYHGDLTKENMPEDVKETYYSNDAPHTMYIGEVIKIIEK